jgi:hypothetical protein
VLTGLFSGILIMPHKKPANGFLTIEQRMFNRIQKHFRVRVEHAFSFVKRFRILGTTYRGGVSTTAQILRLHHIIRVILCATVMHFRLFPYRNTANQNAMFNVLVAEAEALAEDYE